MSKLNDETKNLIVTQLAQFRGYAEVARAVTEETGVSVDRFQVRSYDPTNMAYAGSDKWRAIFETTRHSYLHSIETVPLANKAYRLNELQRNYSDVRAKGNLVLANAVLEQAAKEMQDAHKARHMNDEVRKSPYAHMTSDERRLAVTDMLRQALSAKDKSDSQSAT